jgi:HlyD family secretion protein
VLRLSGTTAATRSYLVQAPRLEGSRLSSVRITKMAPSGTHVRTGDVLVEFDPQAEAKDRLEKEAEYQEASGKLAEKRAEGTAGRVKDETALERAKSDLRKAELEVQKNEIVSRIDQEKNNEKLEEARATLNELQGCFALKRRAAQADLRILEIQEERAEGKLRNAEANARKMIVRSPMDGVVVVNAIARQGRMLALGAGDDVRPGVGFLEVVDTSRMLVRADINQMDLGRVRLGQHARVHLDAYPGISIPAVLEELSPLGRAGDFSDQVRRFAARFPLQETDERLRPDLSAAVDVELAALKDVLLVPCESLADPAGKPYVWLKGLTGFERRTVRPGPRSDLDVVIEAGLLPGDVIRRAAEEGNGAP